ncbi:Allophanate hydrolase subunit 2 [Raoultella planticola]|uniref:Allophanate hydrolase subunit 2 n=1 Tax=Raoultella planticola TaxID=575 RepID=A0A485CW87_RAOPL|nr:Allophanate hydrolase subunit 2 [Raoultella planticola]
MIAWRPTREEAIAELTQALANTRLYGVETNRIYLQQILAFEPFVQGEPWTRCLEQLSYRAATVEVLSAGTQTSGPGLSRTAGLLGGGRPAVRADGRIGRCALGNRLLDNPPGEAALEITLSGPALKFHCAAWRW